MRPRRSRFAVQFKRICGDRVVLFGATYTPVSRLNKVPLVDTGGLVIEVLIYVTMIRLMLKRLAKGVDRELLRPL